MPALAWMHVRSVELLFVAQRTNLLSPHLCRADEVVGAQPVEDELQLGLEVGDLRFELGHIHGIAAAQGGSAVHVVDWGKRLKGFPNIHGL
jgi:hypothetical protein